MLHFSKKKIKPNFLRASFIQNFMRIISEDFFLMSSTPLADSVIYDILLLYAFFGKFAKNERVKPKTFLVYAKFFTKL